MPLSREQVERIAELSRLRLTPEELDQYSHELTRIIDYVGQLTSVSTEGVIPRDQFIQAENVFRSDTILPSLPREKALSNAPEHDDEYFHVPKVLG